MTENIGLHTVYKQGKKLYANIWDTGETLKASRYLALFCVRIWGNGARSKPNVYQRFRTRD